MSLFHKHTEGGMMDIIQCNEPTYLIWKWRPAAAQNKITNKETAIRYGSSIIVHSGEVAILMCEKIPGSKEYLEFFEGPYTGILETRNVSGFAELLSLAYGGGTPFPAEVYFINLSQIQQMKFGVPYFDMFDSSHPDIGIPTAVRGTLSFKITDYRRFIDLHRLHDFDLTQFQTEVRTAIIKCTKQIIINASDSYGISLLQMERRIADMCEILRNELTPRFSNDFGIDVTTVDLIAIDIDKSSEGYCRLLNGSAIV